MTQSAPDGRSARWSWRRFGAVTVPGVQRVVPPAAVAVAPGHRWPERRTHVDFAGVGELRPIAACCSPPSEGHTEMSTPRGRGARVPRRSAAGRPSRPARVRGRGGTCDGLGPRDDRGGRGDRFGVRPVPRPCPPERRPAREADGAGSGAPDEAVFRGTCAGGPRLGLAAGRALRDAKQVGCRFKRGPRPRVLRRHWRPSPRPPASPPPRTDPAPAPARRRPRGRSSHSRPVADARLSARLPRRCAPATPSSRARRSAAAASAGRLAVPQAPHPEARASGTERVPRAVRWPGRRRGSRRHRSRRCRRRTRRPPTAPYEQRDHGRRERRQCRWRTFATAAPRPLPAARGRRREGTGVGGRGGATGDPSGATIRATGVPTIVARRGSR